MEEEKQEKGSLLGQLPVEIASVVLSHLYAGDFVTFHGVCKSWQSISTPTRLLLPPAPTFDHLVQSITRENRPHSPILMFQESGSRCKFFDPLHNQIYTAYIPQLLGAYVRFSDYGWLLVSGDDSSHFFFNPFTKQEVLLPELEKGMKFTAMSFSSPPTSPDCTVFGLSLRSGFVVLERGKEWRILGRVVDPGTGFLPSKNSSPLWYKGQYYWLTKNGNMAVFEIEDDNDCVHMIVHGQTLSLKIRKWQAKGFLVKGGGRGGGDDEELLAVFVPPNKKKINVLKWNDSEYEWEKLYGLGNKALFVGWGGSFLEKQVTARGMENKIYLPFFHGVNGIVYSLSTNKNHSFFDASFSSAGPNQLEQPQHNAWIEPNWTPCDPDFNW